MKTMYRVKLNSDIISEIITETGYLGKGGFPSLYNSQASAQTAADTYGGTVEEVMVPEQPYSIEDIRHMAKNGLMNGARIQGVIKMHIDDLIHSDAEDIFWEADRWILQTETGSLGDIEFFVLNQDNEGNLNMQVTGEIDMEEIENG